MKSEPRLGSLGTAVPAGSGGGPGSLGIWWDTAICWRLLAGLQHRALSFRAFPLAPGTAQAPVSFCLKEVPVIALEVSRPAYCCPQQEKATPLNALSALLGSHVPGSMQKRTGRAVCPWSPLVILKSSSQLCFCEWKRLLKSWNKLYILLLKRIERCAGQCPARLSCPTTAIKVRPFFAGAMRLCHWEETGDTNHL